MAEGVLAQLKVLLGMDISQMKSGLNEAEVRSGRTSKKIEHDFSRMGSVFTRLLGPLSSTGREVSAALDTIGASASEASTAVSAFGSAASIAAGVATGGLLALTGVTLKLFQQIDEQADLAKGIGLTTSEYVKLTSALKLYGVQQEQITPGLSQFFKIVSGLMRSKAGAEAINQLGLSMKNLRLMDTHQQLMTVADAFSKFPDGPTKSAIAAQLFTATLGAKMIPLLDQGAAGVEKLESKFSDLADQSEHVADTTKNLSITWSQATSSLGAFALKVSAAFGVPTMLLAIAHPLATTKALILDFGSVVAEVFKAIVAAVDKLAKALNDLASWTGLPAIPTAGLDKATKYLGALSDAFTSEAAKAAEPLFGSGETAPPGGGGGGNGNNNGNQPNKAAAYLASLKQQISEFGKGDVAKGIDKLKELGATQAQMAAGKGLLNQLEYLKQEADFTKGFQKAQESFSKLLDKIKIPAATQAGWSQLGATLDGIVNSMREAGTSALGIKSATFSGQLQAQAVGVTGAGSGPIGGFVPGFTPSGFGKMRFDMAKLDDAAKHLGQTFSQSFQRMIEGGMGFHEMLQGLLKQIELFAIKALVLKEIGSALSGAGGWVGVVGQAISGMAAPGRAAGGPVSAGQLYTVGEHGPEYFVPGVSGQIVPTSTSMSKNSTLVFAPKMYINTPDADSFKKSSSQIMASAYRQMAAMHARNS